MNVKEVYDVRIKKRNGMKSSAEQISELIHFQEQYYKTEVETEI